MENPFPDGTFVYRSYWNDVDGLAVLMDDYTCTLRDQISPNIQLTERQWINIMLGIADRLSCAHQAGVVHGDLCPANGLQSSRTRLIGSITQLETRK
jgi:serine/threonine protein kinase